MMTLQGAFHSKSYMDRLKELNKNGRRLTSSEKCDQDKKRVFS